MALEPSSLCTQSVWPYRAAKCRQVLCLLASATSGSAPFVTRYSTQSECLRMEEEVMPDPSPSCQSPHSFHKQNTHPCLQATIRAVCFFALRWSMHNRLALSMPSTSTAASSTACSNS